MIRLWVAVIREPGSDPRSTPLVYLSGGPGDAASSTFVTGTVHYVGKPRLLVVIDQRGTGLSQPRLDCAELSAGLDATHPWADRLAGARAVAAACASKYAREGVNINGYNTVEDAADIVELRHALGYPRWLLYGVSAGGRVAQEVIRQDPHGVAGAELDSPLTYQPQGPATLVARANDAIGRLASACASQPACHSQNPDVLTAERAAVARLDADPHPVTVTVNGQSRHVVVTGQDLLAGLFDAQYQRDLIPLIPAGLDAIAKGNYQIIDSLAQAIVSSSTGEALGTNRLTTCADEEAAMTDADRALVAHPGEYGSLLLSWPWVTCGAWNVTPVPHGRLQPAIGPTPVLVREGGLDPVTPPAWAGDITHHLSHSTTIVVPAAGHADYGQGCPLDIGDRFLDNPATKPDTSCIRDLTAPFAG
jgi:pimeloyl-ACP methyl ester carboxylesterase